MKASLLFYAFASLIIRQTTASPATPQTEPSTESRDIWQYPPGMAPRVKYFAVPWEYEIDDIKRADFLGAIFAYENGEVWHAIRRKRLFRMADDIYHEMRWAPFPASHDELMSPEELKEFLSTQESYEVLHAEFMHYYKQTEFNHARSLFKRRGRVDCLHLRCESSEQCNRQSDHTGSCSHCDRWEDCRWFSVGSPNYVGGGPKPWSVPEPQKGEKVPEKGAQESPQK